MALTGAQRNLNWKSATPWLGPKGRLVQHAGKGRAAMAAHAAWLVTNILVVPRPDEASALADLADSLGLVEPRLTHLRAKSRATANDVDGALLATAAALEQQDGSTDPGWLELRAYRDALAAKQTAAQRTRVARPHRVGHSAPESRPSRRRFTT